MQAWAKMMVGSRFVTLLFLSMTIVRGSSPSVQKKGTLRSSPIKVNNVGDSEHMSREKQPWKDTKNKLQPRALVSNVAMESGASILYYPVMTKGGYCDNDLFGRPPDDDIKLYGTAEECCEESFYWKQDNSCLANSGSPQVTAPGPGTRECPCIDKSDALASLVERSCLTSDGQNGVLLAAEGPCVDYSYGSGGCLRHDLFHYPICEMADTGKADNPDYCLRSFCYVDATTCRRSSSERVYRSDYFPRETGLDLFYSYSTCGSTAADWISYWQQSALAGTSISAIVPEYTVPLMYKRNPSGDILTSVGSEYYDSSVPYEGVFMNYFDKLMGIDGADFEMNYTFASKAGRRVHPSSKFTAAIQEIQDGLVDMAIGSFWITGERLKMTSFTVPLYYDKTVLVIPKPDGNNSLDAQTSKVLEPFTMTVWVLIIGLITIAALLSVWFTRYGKSFARRPERWKKGAYARVALDEFLHKGMFFCSAGVDQDEDASLPQKLLMFGFSFFILIVVSAYVANLAAFLTRPVDFVGTIEVVEEKGMRVCAHPALKTEFEVAWPTVNFVFSETGTLGMLDHYAAGKCDVIAASKPDVTSDIDFARAFCEAGLVLTDSLIIEIPVAFPIRPDLASGLSNWMHTGEKKLGITFDAAQEEYRQTICNLELSVNDKKATDYTRIEPQNLFFPFMFFLGFAVLAVILQLWYQWALKKGNTRPLVGRPSLLESNHASVRFKSMKRLVSSRRPLANGTDDSEDDPGSPLPQTNDAPITGAKGLTPSDTNQLGDFYGNGNCNEQLVEKRVKFSNDHGDDRPSALVEQDDFDDNCGVNLDEDAANATSRLQVLLDSGAFDEIVSCVQKIKRQKES